METYIRHSFLRIQCPKKIRKLLEDDASNSMSDYESKEEGAVFIFRGKEKKNKNVDTDH